MKKMRHLIGSFVYKITHIPFIIKRFFNQLHRYDFPDENNGWKKKGHKPVFGNVQTGSIFDPYVICDGDRFLMSASERKTGKIILLESSCGKEWLFKGVLLEGQQNSWDEVVNRGCLLKKNNVWHLWFTGQKRGKSSIGYACGENISCLKRITDKPVLTASIEAEGISVMNPCVLWNEKKQVFQMWYSAGEDYEPDVIFYAESIDGLNWDKDSNPVLTKFPKHEWEKCKIGGCDVKINEDGSYEIFYIAYQNLDVTRICFAKSLDGKKWIRDNDNLIIGPSKKSWDSDATYKPAVIQKNGKTYLWYNGRNANCEYIGLAIRE